MIPTLVAHRGYLVDYPENTLIGLQSALRAGACCVEFDVQFNADLEPVMLHDSDLARTAGGAASIFDLDGGAMASISVHEPARFGSRFAGEPLPRLSQVLELLRVAPAATAFVEIKEESLQQFGMDVVMPRLLTALEPLRSQCVLISFDADALHYARRTSDLRIGWVLHRYDRAHETRAAALTPDFLICNHNKIAHDEAPWAGIWEWMLYDIVDPELALHYARQGVGFIETADIGGMLRHPRLKEKICVHGL